MNLRFRKLSISYLTITLFSLNFNLSNASIKDINGHWAKDKINNFFYNGLISGYEDKTFKPNQEITRAEFIKMINVYFGLEKRAIIDFKDVKEGSWYYKHIQTAVGIGYIDGYEDRTFRPNDKITREEAIKIIIDLISKLDDDIDKIYNFKDGDKVSNWALPYFEGAVEIGIVEGYDTNTIKPDANITRAESVKLLLMILEKYVNIDTNNDGKPDTNIDIDNDRKPDINIDMNDDKEPDINIDIDNNLKPDININAQINNFWTPNINIDIDDDEVPDINVDTDGDEVPDTNIDTDDDELPDTNIDTDDDEVPDINIDTDNDELPDINIDADNDELPDISIDADNDELPDINIDADDDELPDINIDTDDDEVPDINVDTDSSTEDTINPDEEDENDLSSKKPIIYAKEDKIVVNVGHNFCYDTLGINAFDSYGNKIDFNLVGNIGQTPGKYTITAVATDVYGNTSKKNFIIEVVDNPNEITDSNNENFVNMVEEEVFRLVNEYRKENNLKPLEKLKRLNILSQKWSEYMSKKGYASTFYKNEEGVYDFIVNVFPNYGSVTTTNVLKIDLNRFSCDGIYTKLEAKELANMVVDYWKYSGNTIFNEMLNKRMNYYGFGFYTSKENGRLYFYGTQSFSRGRD